MDEFRFEIAAIKFMCSVQVREVVEELYQMVAKIIMGVSSAASFFNEAKSSGTTGGGGALLPVTSGCEQIRWNACDL